MQSLPSYIIWVDLTIGPSLQQTAWNGEAVRLNYIAVWCKWMRIMGLVNIHSNNHVKSGSVFHFFLDLTGICQNLLQVTKVSHGSWSFRTASCSCGMTHGFTSPVHCDILRWRLTRLTWLVLEVLWGAISCYFYLFLGYPLCRSL